MPQNGDLSHKIGTLRSVGYAISQLIVRISAFHALTYE